MRKKTSTAQGSVWGPYSTPALWSNWVAAGAQGQNGQYTQFIYKNDTTNPSAPTSDSAYPPTGWTTTATTPNFANGEYT